MRWVLFDLVVGATLLWLVWGSPTGDLPGDMPPVSPVVPASPVVMAGQPAPFEPMPADPGRPDRGTEGSLPAAPPTAPRPAGAVIARPDMADREVVENRGQRLRALARDAEALSLRGRD